MESYGKKIIEDINFYSVLKDLLKNLWVVLLAALIMWMSVSVYSRAVYVPEYTSSTTFVVNAKNSTSSYSSLSTTNQLATVLSTVFESEILISRVEEDLGTDDLEIEVDAAIVSSTNLLKVSVTSESPELSYRSLVSIIENYESVSDYLFSNAVLVVLKDPSVPTAPSNSLSSGRTQKLAALTGALIAALAVMVISAMRRTVQTKSSARHNLDGTFLGSIGHDAKSQPKNGRKKRKQKSAALITNPLVSIQFLEDCRKICSRLEYSMTNRGEKILLVTSAGENEGKSTVAANLAISLAGRGKRVMLADCDFRRPAIQKIFQIKENDSVDFTKFLLGKTNAEDSGKVCVEKNGVWLCVSHAGYDRPQRLLNSKRLREFLEAMKKEMDFIILDTPPMMLAADAEGLERAADASVLVVREDWNTIRDLNDCMEFMQEGSDDFLGYILNDHQTGFRRGRRTGR